MLPPGSTLWLLRHELRLTLRGRSRQRGRRWGIWASALLPLFMAMAVGLPLGFVLRTVQVPIEPVTYVVAALALGVIFTLMLSQTLAAAVEALYQRADLDLLFSSPLEPRKVLIVRFLGVAFSVTFTFLYFIAPPLIPIALLGHPAWLALLVVLFATGLAASGVGLLLAAGLFRLIGPRRTRTMAQILAALIGAAFFLLAQARNILGEGQSNSLFNQAVAVARDPAFHGWAGADWPLRAMVGEPLPLLALAAIGTGLFLLASSWLGRSFARDAAAAAGAGAGPSRRRTAPSRFSSGAFVTTLLKELRLLLRDPALLTQVLLRVLYLLPFGFLILRNAGRNEVYALPTGAAALALITGQVAASLAWITISAEDAPDLLSCAPTPVRLLWRAKLVAAAVPVAVLLAPFLLPLVVVAPWVGAVATLGCAGTVASACLMNLWWQRPAKRSDFQRRRRGSLYVALAEFAISLLISAATGLLAARLLWAVIPAVLAVLMLVLLRRSEAQIGRSLHAAT